MKKNIIIVFVFVLIGAFLLWNFANGNNVKWNANEKAIVFKSASCGCCINYLPYLKKEGFDVEAKNMQDISYVKSEYRIPRNMESCHTTIIGDYFIEGHVPMEAVKKLLEEKPSILGISMPGMPSGSPGMIGPKIGDFVVYAINNDGSYEEFMRL